MCQENNEPKPNNGTNKTHQPQTHLDVSSDFSTLPLKSFFLWLLSVKPLFYIESLLLLCVCPKAFKTWHLQNQSNGVSLSCWGIFPSDTQHRVICGLSLGEKGCSRSSDRLLCCSGVHVLLTNTMQWERLKFKIQRWHYRWLFSLWDSPKPSAINW